MAKIIEVVQYEANDGSRFNSALEADAHDFKLANGAKIALYTENYLNATGAIDRSRNMQKNTIESFLSFHLAAIEAGTVEVAIERTVFDTPKAEPVVVEGETAAEPVPEQPVADQEPVDGAQPLF